MTPKGRMKPKRKLTPIEARTIDDICRLSEGTAWSCDWGIMFSQIFVFVVERESGEKLATKIAIPRRTFDRFCRWYMTGSMRAKKVVKRKVKR